MPCSFTGGGCKAVGSRPVFSIFPLPPFITFGLPGLPVLAQVLLQCCPNSGPDMQQLFPFGAADDDDEGEEGAAEGEEGDDTDEEVEDEEWQPINNGQALMRLLMVSWCYYCSRGRGCDV